MKNFKFEEELLREGYQFFANNKGNGAYVVIKKGELLDDVVTDFGVLADYYNIKENLDDDKYLVVIYDKKQKIYQVMIVNKKFIIRYPLLCKLFCSKKVRALEVGSILSILDTKLRQQKWQITEIDRTNMINIPTLTRKR